MALSLGCSITDALGNAEGCDDVAAVLRRKVGGMRASGADVEGLLFIGAYELFEEGAVGGG